MTELSQGLFEYHQRSKHRVNHYAPGPTGLDWANQPDPFREFPGAAQLKLPLAATAMAAASRIDEYDPSNTKIATMVNIATMTDDELLRLKQIGLRVRLTSRQWLSVEQAYLAPTFDGDSIWNVFGASAFNDARLGYARAIERYAGGPYAGHLVIVRSRTLDDARPELGWARLAHSAEIHVLPGDHVTLVTRYVGELALVTRAAIDRVHERAAKGLRFASHAPSPVPAHHGPATARVGASGTRSESARAVDDAPERA